MAAFHENILKNEEEFGGFQPDSDEGETFLLNSFDEYPGKLPYDVAYNSETDLNIGETQDIIPVTEEPQIDAMTIDETTEGSVRQSTDEESLTLDEDFRKMIEQDLLRSKSKKKKEEAVLSSFDDLSVQSSEAAIPETEVQAQPEISEPETVPEYIIEPEIQVPEPEVESPKITDEVIRTEDKLPLVEFKDDLPELEIIETFTEGQVTAEHPIKTSKPKRIKQEKIKKEKDDDKTKKKKFFSWKIAFSAAAVFIFLIAAALTAWFFYFSVPKTQVISSKMPVKKDTLFLTKETIKPKPEEKPVMKSVDSLIPKKAVVQEPKKEQAIVLKPKPDTTHKVLTKKKQIPYYKVKELAAKVISPKPEKKDEAAKPAIKKEKGVPKQAEQQKPDVKPKQLAEKQKDTMPIVKPKIIAAKKPDVKPEKVQKPAPKMAAKTESKPIENKKPQESLNKGELYTVEIYSSPSSEDAEEWLKRLKKSGVNGYIKSRKVRGIDWYRVRFGEYPTREEAKAAAMRLGFEQSWIDRIK